MQVEPALAPIQLEYYTSIFLCRIVRMKINSLFRQLQLTEPLKMVMLAAVIGLLSSAGAILLRRGIDFCQKLFFGKASPSLDYLLSLPWSTKMLVPALGGLMAGFLIYYYAKEAKGHGVPEVMEAIIRHGGVIRRRVAIAKLVASAITIGSGGSAGREGPIVQIGSSLGSSIGQWLKIPQKHIRTLVGCGAAAGIAAAFNTPIGGALFAVEVILGDFGISYFSPIVIASVSATVITRLYFGNAPAFEVPPYQLISAYELIIYVFLGILTGIAAVLFIQTLHTIENFFEHSRLHPLLQPLVGGVLVGTIALLYPHIYGVGYETIDHALMGFWGGMFFLVIFFAKLLATSLTLGSGASGGIFSPTLFMGAMLGGFVGTYVHTWFPSHTANIGAYALVGMGAMVSGVIHAPITAIIIIFELTGDYHIILPVMTACIIATLISQHLFPYSIYTIKLNQRGIRLEKGRDINILKNIKVQEVMDRSPAVVTPNTPLRELLKRFMQTPENTLWVVDGEGRVMGRVDFENLRGVLNDLSTLEDVVVAEDISSPLRRSLSPDDTIDHALNVATQIHQDTLPVVDEAMVLRGIITRAQILHAYQQALRRADLALHVREGIVQRGEVQAYPLEEGYWIASLEVPTAFYGKTIRSLNLRKNFDIEVLLVEPKEGKSFIPPADYPFQEGDRFLVLGQKAMLDRLRTWIG